MPHFRNVALKNREEKNVLYGFDNVGSYCT